MDPNNPQSDDEAQALAACYRLLLQKAAERRARLAAAQTKNNDEMETAVSISEPTLG